jgi:transposase
VSDAGVNRVIGLDLGVTSRHSAVVVDATGRVRARRRVSSTVASLNELEQVALAGAAEDSKLTVVIEPTGPMWLPIAVYFGRRGHTVVRVSSSKAADLRRFLLLSACQEQRHRRGDPGAHAAGGAVGAAPG